MRSSTSKVIPSFNDTKSDWPNAMSKEAFYGPLGELVNAIEPHTEADPIALLSQMMVVVGNVVGRNPHFKAEADRHGLNLFATMVGQSSKGRKGTSWGYALKLAKAIDRDWVQNSLKSGLCSGEGLIWALKDPESEDGGEQILDKRLLSEESEFASILKVLSREGNTLSAILRNAWDGKDLNIMTKNNPVKATEPHISIIGHVTKRELNKYLKDNEAGNGFGNRFLWVCVKRSKLLPEGGNLDQAQFDFYSDFIKRKVLEGKDIGLIKRGKDATDLWRSIYSNLSIGHLGTFGAVTGRAEAQVMRIACLYAVLDGKNIISRTHLEAAFEFWKYCENSARFIFGESTGDEVADKILSFARESEEGVSRTEIRDLFNRNKSKIIIEGALSLLEEHKLLEKNKVNQNGTTKEIWYDIRHKENKSGGNSNELAG
ncbi:MAG: hypothetical protein CL674_02895 [Bdellovibrionaceae bacterium]|nr:hypothetical protein [Pseudobdellovibrionaceae bacterium]|tara:strand:+ start:174088 stop:175377 length:1290 start_codon:yes stop_codon:yes gene_type:complete